MRYVARGERALAVVLVLGVGALGIPSFARPASALISGRIMRTGSGSPIAGAVVKASLRPDAKLFESTRTDGKGNYKMPGLPSGVYDVAVVADGGYYVVGGAVSLEPGESRSLSLAVRPKAEGGSPNLQEPPPPEPPPPAEPPPAEPPPTEPPPAEPAEPAAEAPTEETPKPKKVKFWRSPWGGAAIVVGSAVIVGALASSSDKDDSGSASPSSD